MSLARSRVLVVGASAGIGRAFAEHAARHGALVVVTARRGDRLAELPGCHPIAADITDPADCQRVVDESVARLGEIDVILQAAGAGSLAPIEEIDAGTWAQHYAVNVIAPTRITASALPHLSPHAVVSFLSSETTGDNRWGLSAYTASKAAVDATIRSWRVEHPHRRFQRVMLGATMPTEFGNSFAPEMLTRAFERWAAAGISMSFMDTDNVGAALASIIGTMVANPDVDIPDLYFDARGEHIKWATS
jgi:NAD(P)-dependent dehydrogenase (short-subunit alcohol dehydrogenase family)